MQRLLYIGHSCPELSVEAFRLAALAAKECTVDVNLYRDAFQAYAAAVSAHPEQETEPLTLDQDWVTQARLAAQKENDKLDVELKSYQSNLIKESIRVSFIKM